MNPWFRLHADLVNNPKAQKLSPELFKTWINFLCVACEHDGVLPDVEDLAFKVRASLHDTLQALQTLVTSDLLTVTKNQHGETFAPKNWQERQYKSDSSAERVRRHREKKKSVTETVTVTPPEQSRADTEQIGKELTNVSSKKPRGTRLPEGWEVSAEGMQFAYAQGMDDRAIVTESDKFRDYWHAVSGQKGVKSDWEATWRNWIRNRRTNENTARQPTKTERIKLAGNAAVAELFADIDREEAENRAAEGFDRTKLLGF